MVLHRRRSVRDGRPRGAWCDAAMWEHKTRGSDWWYEKDHSKCEEGHVIFREGDGRDDVWYKAVLRKLGTMRMRTKHCELHDPEDGLCYCGIHSTPDVTMEAIPCTSDNSLPHPDHNAKQYHPEYFVMEEASFRQVYADHT